MGTNYQLFAPPSREWIGRIILKQPRALNAINTPLMQETTEALRAFEADSKLKRSYFPEKVGPFRRL